MTRKLEGRALAVSNAMKTRSDYLYYIVMEMDKANVPKTDEILKRAIYKVGQSWAKMLGPVDSPRAFHDALFTEDLYQILQLEMQRDERDEIELHFRSCPHVERWKEMNLDKAMIKRLCDIACRVDYGNVESCGLNLQMETRLGKGDDRCILVISKKDKQ
jgi:hypothetical protein